jgi:hypothetical protein
MRRHILADAVKSHVVGRTAAEFSTHPTIHAKRVFLFAVGRRLTCLLIDGVLRVRRPTGRGHFRSLTNPVSLPDSCRWTGAEVPGWLIALTVQARGGTSAVSGSIRSRGASRC